MVDGCFREHVHVIESLNNQSFPKELFEILWVEFYDKPNAKLAGMADNLRVITLGNPRDTEYHSSYCFNEGIRQSKGEVLVIPDADVMVQPSFLDSIWREHESCERLAMYFHRLNEPRELHDDVKSYQLDYLKSMTRVTTTSNFGGCLTVRKKWLVEINGYEQESTFGSGAHANGYDVNTRLKNLGLHIMWHPSERLYHPWHPGTDSGSMRYKLQHMIVEYRQSTMMTVAFQGMDKSRNTGIPDVLRQKLLGVKTKSTGVKKLWEWAANPARLRTMLFC